MRQLIVLICDLTERVDYALRLPLGCQCEAVEHLHQFHCMKVAAVVFDANPLAVVFKREPERLVNFRMGGRCHVVLV